MKKDRINPRLPSLKTRKNMLLKLTSIIIFFLIASLIISYAVEKLKNLNYFTVKNIIVSEANPNTFLYLKGRNIFNIDIKKEARYIWEAYPQYKNVRIIKFLPDSLLIDFIKRKPVGIIMLYRYLYVDMDQVIFNIPSGSPALELPQIRGLETKIFGPKPGTKYNLKELTLALNIIKELNLTRVSRVYKVKVVDVANPANASFILQADGQLMNDLKAGEVKAPQALEVRIGQDDIKGRVKILNTLLPNIKNDFTDVKYIDLRFKESVVKFNDAK